MNVQGFLRGMMAKNMESEKFLKLVMTTVENQLKEWDDRYEVWLLKFENYHIHVFHNEKQYTFELSEEEAKFLQHKSPFSLDKKIWVELEQQGLEILRGYGDYLDKVFY